MKTYTLRNVFRVLEGFIRTEASNAYVKKGVCERRPVGPLSKSRFHRNRILVEPLDVDVSLNLAAPRRGRDDIREAVDCFSVFFFFCLSPIHSSQSNEQPLEETQAMKNFNLQLEASSTDIRLRKL